MAVKYYQISLKDTFSDCKDMFMDDVPSFFQLLEQHFDISLFIPQIFCHAFYQHLGRNRDYPLTGFSAALILQKIIPINLLSAKGTNGVIKPAPANFRLIVFFVILLSQDTGILQNLRR